MVTSQRVSASLLDAYHVDIDTGVSIIQAGVNVTKSLLLFYNIQPILLNVNIYYIYIYIVYSDYSEFPISITLKGLLISPS